MMLGVQDMADLWFGTLREEATRRADAYLATHDLPECFVMDGEKYEAFVHELEVLLFDGWFKGEFDE